MKLLNRTTNFYLFLSLPIILIAMLVVFLLVRHFNLQHVEHSLQAEHNEIITRAKHIKKYYIEDELSDELIIHEIPLDSFIKDNYKTIVIYDSLEQEHKPYRQLETTQQIAGKKYQIIIQKSLVENSTLAYSIGISIIILILVLSGVFLLMTHILSKKVWRPFYTMLNSLDSFKAGVIPYKSIKQTDVEEFKKLDEAFVKMTTRIEKDFFIYKEFIDIVSHEYQTPLSVIGNNAELLLQNPQLNEEAYLHINQIIEYVRKLNRLNRSLLLLSRIDNHQFVSVEKVSVKVLIKKIFEEQKHKIEYKEIELKMAFSGDIELKVNSTLAELLFTNLIQNAIRHNWKTGGRIICEIREGNFHLYNTGQPLLFPVEKIFQKFNKNSTSKESIGLGLSIVKSICKQYGYYIFYEFIQEKQEHHFMITFSKK